jgi:hypothetical protein
VSVSMFYPLVTVLRSSRTPCWVTRAGRQSGSRTQGWAFVVRPHTGVPEIGRPTNAQPCSDHSSALPVASSKKSPPIRVARHCGRRRDSVCKPTDFWYSSMRAVCIRYPARRDPCANICTFEPNDPARSDTCANICTFELNDPTRSDTSPQHLSGNTKQ